MLCKNWCLPAAPDDGFTALRSPSDSRCAIACKWALTFTDEPSLALDSFELEEACGAASCCTGACSVCCAEAFDP